MFRNLPGTFLATLVIQIVTVAGGILSARLLLPQGKGELAAIILWPSLLAAVGSLGIGDAIAYFSANRTNTGERNLVGTGISMAAGLSALLIGIGYLVVPRALAGYGETVVATSLSYLWFIPLNLLTLFQMAVLLGRMKLGSYNLLRSSVHVATVAGMVVLYSVHAVSVRSFAMASLFANVIVLGLTTFSVMKFDVAAWIPDLQLGRRLLSYGMRAYMGSVASLFTFRLDQMLMSLFLRPSSLGYYVVALTVAAGGSLAALTIAVVVFPHLANMSSDGARADMLGRYLRLSLLFSLAAVAVLFVGAPWLIRFFFGPSFSESVDPARILLLASIPQGVSVLFAAAFKAYGKPLLSSRAEALGFVMSGVLLAVFLPTLQMRGAALASLLSYSTVALYMAWQMKTKLAVGLTNLLRPGAGEAETVREFLCRVQRAMGTPVP